MEKKKEDFTQPYLKIVNKNPFILAEDSFQCQSIHPSRWYKCSLNALRFY